MKYEKTLILIKPGNIERKIIGAILQRFENKGFDILALKMCKPSKVQYSQHYEEHSGKSFYNALLQYMQSGLVVALVVGGDNAVATCRLLAGSTNPADATPGSIRGDFALSMPENVIHASDSVKSAHREIKIFFSASEIRKV